jgi:hypothetical protein
MVLLSRVSVQMSLRELATERHVMEVLRSRVAWLDGAEQALLTMYLESGSSMGQIARLTGLRRSTIARRIRKIIARLCDETYVVCLRQRGQFSEHELAIIKDHFVRGLSVRLIVDSRRVTPYRVRVTIRRARRLLAEQEPVPEAGRGGLRPESWDVSTCSRQSRELKDMEMIARARDWVAEDDCGSEAPAHIRNPKSQG